MSLYSSLYAGASGMLAHEKATSIISTNIANMTTIGYKRSSAAFYDIVTTPHNAPGYQAGGVTASRQLNANTPGAYQKTSSRTDAAIIGNGFFPVRATTNSSDELLYTRNGQFSLDAEGILRNSAGFVAYGWALDSQGVPSTTLTPVDVSQLENISLPTTTIEMQLNLSANETHYDPHRVLPAQQLPIDNLPPHYSRSIEVYDGDGTPRQMTLEFRRTVGPMAHFTSNFSGAFEYDDVLVNNLSGPTPDIVAGDNFSISDGTNTLDINFVNGAADPSLNEANTLRDVMNLINNYQPAPATEPIFAANLTQDGQVLVRAVDHSVSLDISGSSANVLGNGGFRFIQDPDAAPDYIYEPDVDLTDASDPTYPTQSDFPATANTPNVYNWWELTIKTPDPANPSGDTLVEQRKGLINFNSDGTPNLTLDADGNALVDMSSTPLDFDNSIASDDTGMVLDLSRLSQLASEYSVTNSNQDGAPIAAADSFDIGRDGSFRARYSNGIEIDIFRIPVATFTNPNGLADRNGTVFSETADSGAANIVSAGTLGAGFMEARALEESNVDISDEFGHMIVSQRAYGMNGKIIQAVDEMTSYLVQLSR